MPKPEDIISRVIIEGTKDAADQIAAIGEAGREAFDAMAESVRAAADAQGQIEAGLAGTRSALEGFADQARAGVTATDDLRSALTGIGDAFVSGIGSGVSDAFGPLFQALDRLSAGAFSGVASGVSAVVQSFSSLRASVSAAAPDLLKVFQVLGSAVGIGTTTLSVKELSATLARLGPVASAAGAALSGLAVIATGIGAALLSVAKSTAATTNAMKAGGAEIGATANEFQALNDVAELAGVPIQALTGAISQIGAGNKSAVAGLKELGVSLRDAEGNLKRPVDLFSEFAQKLARVPDASERARIAMAMFGTVAGRSILPALESLRDGLGAYEAALRDQGRGIDELTQKIAKDFTQATIGLGKSFEGVGASIGNAVLPAFTAMSEVLANVVQVSRSVVVQFTGPVIDAFGGVLNVVSSLVGAFGFLIGTLAGITNFGKAVKVLDPTGISDFLGVLSGVGGALNSVAGAIRRFSGTSEQAGATIAAMGDQAQSSVERVKNSFEQLAQTGQQSVSVLSDSVGRANNAFAILGNESGSISVLDEEFRKTGATSRTESGVIAGAVHSIRSAIDAIDFSVLSRSAGAAFDQVYNAVASGASQLTTTLSGLAGELQAYFSEIDFSALLGSLPIAAQEAFDQTVEVVAVGAEQIGSALSFDFGATFGPLVTAAQNAFQSVTSQANASTAQIRTALQGVKSATTGLWDSMDDGFASAVSSILSGLGQIISKLDQVAAQAARVASELAKVNSGGSGGSGYARGGPVFGAGTSTSDSVPAWLSTGEWVIRAAAVRRYGSSFFAALNGMRVPVQALRDLVHGFSAGGPVHVPVRDLVQGFASGGLVTGGSGSFQSVVDALRSGGLERSDGGTTRLDLTIGNETFRGLLAPRDVADKLTRFALGEQVRSGGRKPGWYYS